MSNQLSHLERLVDQSVTEINSRIDNNCSDISAISKRITTENSQLRSYINERVNSITTEFPATLARMGSDVDTKISRTTDKIKSYIDSKVASLPRPVDIENICDNAIKKCVNQGIFVEKKDVISINDRLASLQLNPLNGKILDELKSDISSLKEKNRDLERELSEFKKLQTTPISAVSEAEKNAWNNFRIKAERICDEMPEIKCELAESRKVVQALDIKSRRPNVIIEQLQEAQNENTVDTVYDILDLALSDENRREVQILRPFRLGVKSNNGPPRKILAEVSTTRGREIILDNARLITRLGNDGKTYYINEDLPDPVKRKKSD